jgi:hypothetical protein
MLSTSNYLTLSEWIALIQQDPEQANQHVIWLRAQIKIQGIMADPALQIGIEDYNRAQDLLAKAAHDPQQAERIARMAAVGQITLSGYPSHDDWLKLIQDDPTFARHICLELKTKQALLGLYAPPALQKSMDAYQFLASQQQT